MDKTCKERLESEFNNTFETLKDLWEFYLDDSPLDHPEHETNMYEYGLCFDYVAPFTFKDQREGYFRYQLSWGGPSDEFRIYAQKIDDYRFSVYKIEYWFLDWFDGACKTLWPTGDYFELIEEIFEMFFVESGTANYQLETALA